MDDEDDYKLEPEERAERDELARRVDEATGPETDYESPAAYASAWIANFSGIADAPPFLELMRTAEEGSGSSWSDEYLHFSGTDAHGVIPGRFWDMLEVMTGQEFRKRPVYFSCSC